MKLFAITFAFLFVTVAAEQPELTILHPQFLFDNAWHHQSLGHQLQTEFDEAYYAANALVNSILFTSSLNTLNDYGSHSEVVKGLYNPVFDALDVIPIGDCRTQVQNQLNTVVGFTGSRAGVCTRNYHRDASTEADEVISNIHSMNDEYLKLSRFVYHEFSGSNALTEGEAISERINATFVDLKNKLTVEPVDKDAFEAALANLLEKFNDCLRDAEENTRNMLVFTHAQIEVCKDMYDINTRASRVTGFKDYTSELEKAMEAIAPYQW